MKWQYRTNGKSYDSKFSAIDEYEKHKKGLCLETPNEYDSYNFVNEPEKDLTDLLRYEAQKVRAENNYLRLFYSGGADSHAVLNTFIQNNIHLDEIVCLKCGFKNADFEIDQFALPFLSANKDKLKSSEIKVLEPTIQDYEKWYKNDWVSEYLKHKWTSTVAFFRLIDQPYDFNDGALNIKGKDKPKIVQHKGDLYTYISDSNSEIQQNVYHFMLENPAILSKQCHMLINHLPSILDFNQETANKVLYNDNSSVLPKKQNYYLPAKMSKNKLEMFYVNEKEELALSQAIKECPEVLANWTHGTNKIKQSKFSKWFNQGRPEYGTIGIQSKFFCLTDNKVCTIDELYPTGFTHENIVASQNR